MLWPRTAYGNRTRLCDSGSEIHTAQLLFISLVYILEVIFCIYTYFSEPAVTAVKVHATDSVYSEMNDYDAPRQKGM
jgi:hypothetical protein